MILWICYKLASQLFLWFSSLTKVTMQANVFPIASGSFPQNLPHTQQVSQLGFSSSLQLRFRSSHCISSRNRQIDLTSLFCSTAFTFATPLCRVSGSWLHSTPAQLLCESRILKFRQKLLCNWKQWDSEVSLSESDLMNPQFWSTILVQFSLWTCYLQTVSTLWQTLKSLLWIPITAAKVSQPNTKTKGHQAQPLRRISGKKKRLLGVHRQALLPQESPLAPNHVQTSREQQQNWKASCLSPPVCISQTVKCFTHIVRIKDFELLLRQLHTYFCTLIQGAYFCSAVTPILEFSITHNRKRKIHISDWAE